jgi:uncharacterized phage-like protein YoqJ
MRRMAFTGARPQHLSPTQVETAKNFLRNSINKAVIQGFDEFITGGAIGIDTWAAEYVLEARENNKAIKLTVAIPFVGQEKKWSAALQDNYKRILDKADNVVDVSNGSDTLLAVIKFHNRNKYMVNQLTQDDDWLVGVWTGEKGGTKHCLDYAITNKMRNVFVLNLKENKKNVYRNGVLE